MGFFKSLVCFLGCSHFVTAFPKERQLQAGNSEGVAGKVYGSLDLPVVATRHVLGRNIDQVFPKSDTNTDLPLIPVKAFLVRELVWIKNFMDFNDANFKLSGTLPWFEKWTTDNRGKFEDFINRHDGSGPPTLADFFIVEFFGYKDFADQKFGNCSIRNCGCKNVPTMWTIVDRYKESPVKARRVYFTLRLFDFHFKNSCVLGRILDETRSEIQGLCLNFAEVFAHPAKEEWDICLILGLTALAGLAIAIAPTVFTEGVQSSLFVQAGNAAFLAGFENLANLTSELGSADVVAPVSNSHFIPEFFEPLTDTVVKRALSPPQESTMQTVAQISSSIRVPEFKRQRVFRLLAIFGNLTLSILSSNSRGHLKRAVSGPSLPNPSESPLSGGQILSGLDSFTSVGDGFWQTDFGPTLHQVSEDPLLFAGLSGLNPNAETNSIDPLLAYSIDMQSFSKTQNSSLGKRPTFARLGVILLPTTPQGDVAGPSLMNLTYHRRAVESFPSEMDPAFEDLANPSNHGNAVQSGHVRVSNATARWINAARDFQQLSKSGIRKRSPGDRDGWDALPVPLAWDNLDAGLAPEETQLLTTASAFLSNFRRLTRIEEQARARNRTTVKARRDSLKIPPGSEGHLNARFAMPRLKLWETSNNDGATYAELTHFIQYDNSQTAESKSDVNALIAVLVESAKQSARHSVLFSEYIGLGPAKPTGWKRAEGSIEVYDAHHDHPESLAITLRLDHPVIKNVYSTEICYKPHYVGNTKANARSCETTVAEIVTRLTFAVFGRAISLVDASTLDSWREGAPAEIALQFSKLFSSIPNMKKLLDLEKNPGKVKDGIRQKLLSQLAAKAWTDQGCYLNCAPPNEHSPKCGTGEVWCPPGGSKICQPSCWDGGQQKNVLPYGWNEAQSPAWNLSLDNVQELSWRLANNEYRDWRPGNLGLFFFEENGFERVPTMGVCNSEYNLVYKFNKHGVDHYHEKKSFPCSCGGKYGDKSKEIWEMAGLTKGIRDPQQVHNCDEVLKPTLKTDIMAYAINMCNIFFYVAYEPADPVKSENPPKSDGGRQQTESLPPEWNEMDMPQKRKEVPHSPMPFVMRTLIRSNVERVVRRDPDANPLPKAKWEQNMDDGRNFCERLHVTLEQGLSLGLPTEELSKAACWRWKEKALRKKPCFVGSHKQCGFDLISHRIYHACGKCHDDKCQKPLWAS